MVNETQKITCDIEDKVQNSNIFFLGRISGIGITTSSYLCLYGLYDDYSQVHLNISKRGINLLFIEKNNVVLDKPCIISLYNFSSIGTPMHPVLINIKKLIPPFDATNWTLIGRCQDYQIIT